LHFTRKYTLIGRELEVKDDENLSTQTTEVNNSLRRLWAAIRHNYGAVLAAVFVCGLLIWIVGCQSQVSSLSDPETKVTREQLRVEYEDAIADLQRQVETLGNTYRLKQEELDRQDSLKKQLLEVGAVVAETGKVNLLGLLGIAGGILGVGIAVDNRRKDTVIQVQKRELAATKTTTT